MKATIIADNISAYTYQRITTFELEYPRYIHAELLTHRQFSRNSASSRAIPISKMIELVNDDPAVPLHWGLNQSGMQAQDKEADESLSISTWLEARNSAIKYAKELQALGLHKQVVNRVLEPFQMIKVLVTATDYDNFFNLRLHKDAQPEIRQLAELMYKAMQLSKPEVLYAGEWHTPYVNHSRHTISGILKYFLWDKNENVQYLSLDEAIKISCSCSAQVSYRKNNTSLEKALSIYDKLVNSNPVHASAFEHCATPIDIETTDKSITHFDVNDTPYSGNFKNWVQYRQLIPNHDCKEFILK